MKKLLMTKGTAILLSVCAATALCANFVGACSDDEDDIYYGEEFKTRAATTANSSGDASVYRLNSPLYTVTKAPFKFSKKMTQYATFSYVIIANDAFNGFNVRVTKTDTETITSVQYRDACSLLLRKAAAIPVFIHSTSFSPPFSFPT